MREAAQAPARKQVTTVRRATEAAEAGGADIAADGADTETEGVFHEEPDDETGDDAEEEAVVDVGFADQWINAAHREWAGRRVCLRLSGSRMGPLTR